MPPKIISREFYSNCFLEAIKAKIKSPKTVTITMVKKSEAGCPHFLWSDGLFDYDFGAEKRLEGVHVLLFKGVVRKRGLGFNKKYKKLMDERWNREPVG